MFAGGGYVTQLWVAVLARSVTGAMVAGLLAKRRPRPSLRLPARSEMQRPNQSAQRLFEPADHLLERGERIGIVAEIGPTAPGVQGRSAGASSSPTDGDPRNLKS